MTMGWWDDDEVPGDGRWTELTQYDEDVIWGTIFDDFGFQPLRTDAEMPTFDEPIGSTTWAIQLDDDDRGGRAIAERTARAALAAGLQIAAGADPWIAALDWQRVCYQVAPSDLTGDRDWFVPAVPDGDYSLFVARDLRFGWLGHPLEPSICVFGDLLAPMRYLFDELGWRVLREDGRPRRHLRLV
jgi:hypothetical protein